MQDNTRYKLSDTTAKSKYNHDIRISAPVYRLILPCKLETERQ
jgi:hypothetical protein